MPDQFIGRSDHLDNFEYPGIQKFTASTNGVGSYYSIMWYEIHRHNVSISDYQVQNALGGGGGVWLLR